MGKRGLSLVFALALAALATLLLVVYVRSAEQKALGADSVQVFVAKQKIPAGTSVESAVAKSLLAKQPLPSKALVEGVVTDLEQIKGKVTSGEILRGEQLVGSRFQAPAKSRGVIPIPDGREAMSIEVAAPPGVAGFVRTGDVVSVIARAGKAGPEGGSRVQYLVRGVEVIAVGQRAAKEESKDQGGIARSTTSQKVLLTLALTSVEAEKVAFAALEGELWFTLLPEGAKTSAPTSGRTAENLFS